MRYKHYTQQFVYSDIVIYRTISPLYSYRDIAGHERFGHMTRVYYKYA